MSKQALYNEQAESSKRVRLQLEKLILESSRGNSSMEQVAQLAQAHVAVCASEREAIKAGNPTTMVAG